jgi:hypothetical protein
VPSRPAEAKRGQLGSKSGSWRPRRAGHNELGKWDDAEGQGALAVVDDEALALDRVDVLADGDDGDAAGFAGADDAEAVEVEVHPADGADLGRRVSTRANRPAIRSRSLSVSAVQNPGSTLCPAATA